MHTTRRPSSTRTADAHEQVLALAEHTGPDAPRAVRAALATLAAALGDPAVETIRAGRLGYDAEDGALPDLIDWR